MKSCRRRSSSPWGDAGVLHHGLATLGGGATLAGVILGAATVFVIERQLDKAAWFALAAAVPAFFGFIHGEEIGVAQSPVVALGSLGVAAMLFAFDRYAHVVPAAPSEMHGDREMTTRPAE
jgi:AGZA family xanthine/uracil permease-like MFS transporter